MKILLAVSAHEQSHDVSKVAVRLFPDAHFVILSSASTEHLIYAEPISGAILTAGFSLEGLLAAETQADEAVGAAHELIDNSETVVGIGDPGPIICDLASQQRADLVVVGRGTHGWLAHLFAPSVSNYVIQNAPCPVVVIREPTPTTQ